MLNSCEKIAALWAVRWPTAVVYDDNGILNEEGLRYENEFVRHKVLDVIGDCYVNGNLILSDYEGVQPDIN